MPASVRRRECDEPHAIPVQSRRISRVVFRVGIIRLFETLKERDTYICQFELIAAIMPFLSVPEEWFTGYPVELWIDNAGAIGALIKGYSGVPDCARIVNLFHFTIAKLGITSLWIDYVPTDSNPADVPSRLHEMTDTEARIATSTFGEKIMHPVVPRFTNDQGDWLTSKEIASSVWGDD